MNTKASHFARQPLSPVGKVAFWTLLVSTILGLAGAITLILVTGEPSSDSLISFFSALIALLLIASGVRWIQVLGTLVSGLHLYTFFTVPYVLASLTDPKSTQIAGGFGKFVGIVVLGTLSLVAFIACVAVMTQNYRHESHQTPRWFSWATSGSIGMMLGALVLGAIVQPAGASGTTYTNGVPTVHMSANSFEQSSVTITKGSKLVLVDDTSVMHILGNGSWQNNQAQAKREANAPVVNNLRVNGNSVEIGPFTAAGTYRIYCVIHSGMELMIIVQ